MNAASFHISKSDARSTRDETVRNISSGEIKFDRGLPARRLATLISKRDYGFGGSRGKGGHVENSISRIIVLRGPTIELMGRRVPAKATPLSLA
jgi:hypothetical protein